MDSFKIISFVVFVFGTTLISNVQSDNRVRVTVYYESYCPYSKSFISAYLEPTYRLVGSIMNIEMVPTSLLLNEKDRSTPVFKCQHGELECQANIIQTCAQKVYGSSDPRVLKMIFCMEKSADTVNSANQCAIQTGLNYPSILACTKSSSAPYYQLANSIKRFSLNPPMKYFPWITINGMTDTALQAQTRSNLLSVVCKYYTGPKPSACYSSG